MQHMEVLVVPVISLMGLAFAYSSILRYSQDRKFTSIAFGLLFGGSIIMAMTFPISLGEGFIFDLRSLLLGLCVAFAGWRAGVIALLFAVGYRVYLGGGGVVTGVVGLCLAFAIAVVWLRFAAPRVKSAPLADIGLGASISGTFAAVVLLPKDVAMMVLTDLAPFITIGNVVGALALGFVFRREMQFFQDSEKLRMHAMIDPLTNLLNRRGTVESMKNVTHGKGEGRAMLCFDLDKFKQINDQYGHEAGDIVLSTIAARIENAIRGEVVFSRHGGDEFTIYFPVMERMAIASVADRICSCVSKEPVMYKGERLIVTISIGCYWTMDAIAFDEMLRKADEQLLVSKSKGRNRSTIYIDTPEKDAAAAQRGLVYVG